MATAKVRPIFKTAPALGMTWDEAIEAFILSRENATHGANKVCRAATLDIYRKDIGRLIEFMRQRGHTHYNQMSRLDMRAFVTWVRKDSGWSPATQNKMWRGVRTFFNWISKDEMCAELGMMSWKSEMPKIPRMDRKEHIVTAEQVLEFLNAIDTKTRAGLRDHTIVSLMIDCGPRAGEIMHLKLEHLNLQQGTIIIPVEGKTGTATIPISTRTVSLLKTWLARRKTFVQHEGGKLNTFVFVGDNGRPIQSENYLSKRFQRLRTKNGVGSGAHANVTPHMLRHFFATSFLKNGGGLHELKELTRHKSYDTLNVYVHLAGADAIKAAHERSSPLQHLERQVMAEKRKRQEKRK